SFLFSLYKFEHNKSVIYLYKFLILLDELDLSVSEFMLINNNYQLEYGDQLKEEFYGNHFTGNTESYGELVKEIEKYLEHDYDWYLEMMKHYLNLIIEDRKSTRLNSSHVSISYAVFCLKKKK